MGISTGAALLGGAAISGISGAIGADKAADAARSASRRSNALQRYMYDTNRADQAPWRNIGVQALGQLGSVYGFNTNGKATGQPGNFDAFTQSPDYQFRLTQGINALDRSAASRGRLYSGAQMRAAQDYGQGAASQEYGNWFNRLSSLAGNGQAATNQVGQYGMNYANQAGQNFMNAGNAQASSYMNRANALGNFVSDAAYGYGRMNHVDGLDQAQSDWAYRTGNR